MMEQSFLAWPASTTRWNICITCSPTSPTPILLLRKITSILTCFSLEVPDPTLQEITRRTGLPASTWSRTW